jgi:hypothetical protein
LELVRVKKWRLDVFGMGMGGEIFSVEMRGCMRIVGLWVMRGFFLGFGYKLFSL